MHTLAGKYKLKIHTIIRKYGKTPKVVFVDKNTESTVASYLTPNEVNLFKRGFTVTKDPFFEFEDINKLIVHKYYCFQRHYLNKKK